MPGTLCLSTCLSTRHPITTRYCFSGSILYGLGVLSLPDRSRSMHGLDDATIFTYRKDVFLERYVVGSDFVGVCGCLSRFPPLASDQFFTLNSLLRTRIRSQAAMWVSYRPDQAWVALLLNIASSISCHKLAGVALARCLSRQVKNDPPTADRTAQLAGWAMGVLGRPIPRAPGAGGRYIGLEWAVASRFRPSWGGRGRSEAGRSVRVCVCEDWAVSNVGLAPVGHAANLTPLSGPEARCTSTF